MGIFTFNNLLSAVKTNGLSESFLPPMILNMSITASVIILFVLLARLALKKAPKIFSYALWAVVLFRLLCPVSVTTDFSLLGLFDTPAMENTQHTTAVEYIPYDVVHTPNLEVQLPVPPAINDAANDTLPQEHAALGADPLEGEFAIGSLIWLLGIAAMAIYSAVSYILLRRKLVGSVLLRDNIYLADGIGSPFVMGFIRPKIYLPSALSEQEQQYIILHEQHHIRRGDHVIKALAFFALCIHWFNPLVWVAFILSSKDMEMSCDEAVVKKLGEEIRADYSASLLSLATGRRIIAGTPLAFGEGDTKSRIKNMLNWKKPKVWLIVAAATVVAVIAVVCGTNASTKSTVKTEQTENGVEVMLTLKAPIRSYAIYEEIYQGGRLISGKPVALNGYADDVWDDMPYKHTFKLGVRSELLAGGGFSGELTSWHEENGAAAERKTILPKDAYTGMGHIVGTGNVEGTLSKESHSIDAGDDVILLSVVLSTAPDGEICVYRNGWSLAKGNDTVVQYRLVTSTETAEAFEDMPLDLAQTLYDLRVETLNDRDDPGAQMAVRALLDAMGASAFGPYELEYYDISEGRHFSALRHAGTYWPGGTGPQPPYEKTALVIWYPQMAETVREHRSTMIDLLLALVPELEEVHIGYAAVGGTNGYAGSSDKDGAYIKEYLGYDGFEELGQSAAGIRALIEFLGWTGEVADPEAVGHYGTAGDVAYYLEMAAGTEFQTMTAEEQAAILGEYEDLLAGYLLRARKSTDGKTAYIIGQYNGDPTESPLYKMYSISGSIGEEEWNLLYREEDSAAVDTALTANQIPDVGYLIDGSYIRWSSDSALIMIQPKDSELLLGVPWNRYLHTPNGREYIVDAVSRGIDVCGRTDTFLYVYRISERFGEIAERIALTEAEAQAILAEERVTITDGFGFSATLHIDGQTTSYNERKGIPQTVLDLAVEKCDYRFGDPSYITDTIREARLDCDWLSEPLYADEADLPRLREILKQAEHDSMSGCGYNATLTLTFTGGEKLTVFKGCDSCDTIVFGSYGGYSIGRSENTEFWEMFGLDPETKGPIVSTYEPKTFVSAFIQAEDVGDLLNGFTPWDLYYDLDTYEYTEADPLSCYVYYHLTRPQFESFRTALEERLGGMPDEIRIDGNWDETGGDPRDVAYITVSGPRSRAEIEELVAVVRQSQGLPPIHPMEEQEQLPEAPPSETDIHNALMSNYTVLHDESEATHPYRTEAHHVWATRQDGNTANVYALVNFTTYGWENGRQKRIAWWDGPAKLTFTWSNGWQLTDFWRWTENEQYETAIQNRFPADVAEIALGPMDSDISASMNTCTYEAAVAYYATQSGLSVYQPFTPADVEFTNQAIYTTEDTMTHQERAEWAHESFNDPVYALLVEEDMPCGSAIVWVEQEGSPHGTMSRLCIRFPDGTKGFLPLAKESYFQAAVPDTMHFLRLDGKFVYESQFSEELTMSEGETLIHLKGTYHYEVDLVAKTVSLTVLQ